MDKEDRGNLSKHGNVKNRIYMEKQFVNNSESVNSKKEKVLVTGASGFLGKRLCASLLEKGYNIRIFLRNKIIDNYFKNFEAEIYYGDLRDPESLKNAINGVDIVVHAAAEQKGEWQDFKQTTIDGTENIISYCRQYNVRRLVYISSMSVYQISGTNPGSIIEENSPLENKPQKRGFYSWSKLEAEKIVKAAMSRNNGFTTVILRPATIIGPGGQVFSPIVGISVYNKIFIVLGKNSNRLPFVYIDNIVDAILLSIEHENAAGKIFNVIDDNCITKREYVNKVKEALFPKSICINLPYWLVYLLVMLQENVFKMIRKNPILTRYRLSSASNDVVYSSDKIKNELGWTPKVTIHRGLEELFGWYKKEIS